MFRILLFILVVIAGVSGFSWMKASALPDWYDQTALEGANDPVEEFSKIIQNQGMEAFFSGKLSDLLAGKLILNQDEFNALILTSIAVNADGQKLLAVSDIVRAQIHENGLEIGLVINLKKLKQQNADKFNDLLGVLSILNDERVYLAVTGQPVAKNGELAFADNIAFKIGNLSVSDSLLGSIGISTEQLKQQTLKISYLTIKDVSLEGNNIGMAVRPSF